MINDEKEKNNKEIIKIKFLLPNNNYNYTKCILHQRYLFTYFLQLLFSQISLPFEFHGGTAIPPKKLFGS